jgi:hypothetical protein
MNTDRENNHGEYWADEGIYMTFNVKKLWKWLLSLFLLLGVAQAQVSYCGVDVAKDLVPNGGVAKGTLSNLFTYSEDLTNAAWTKTRSTITANAITAPDGTLTADKVVEDGTAANDHRVQYSFAGLTNGVRYRLSFYAKAGERTWIGTYSGFSSAGNLTNFNLTTGAVGTVSSGVRSAYSTPVGDGWYRYTMVVTSNATSGITYIYLGEADNDTTYSGDSASGAYVWGASLQLETDPADYLQAVASATTLGPLCPLGYSQSLTDPSRCFLVSPITSRTFRTW